MNKDVSEEILLKTGLTLAGIREGIKALEEGRITPWDEVAQELGLNDDTALLEACREALRRSNSVDDTIIARLDERLEV